MLFKGFVDETLYDNSNSSHNSSELDSGDVERPVDSADVEYAGDSGKVERAGDVEKRAVDNGDEECAVVGGEERAEDSDDVERARYGGGEEGASRDDLNYIETVDEGGGDRQEKEKNQLTNLETEVNKL